LINNNKHKQTMNEPIETCKACGAKLRANVRFCPRCGANQAEESDKKFCVVYGPRNILRSLVAAEVLADGRTIAVVHGKEEVRIPIEKDTDLVVKGSGLNNGVKTFHISAEAPGFIQLSSNNMTGAIDAEWFERLEERKKVRTGQTRRNLRFVLIYLLVATLVCLVAFALGVSGVFGG